MTMMKLESIINKDEVQSEIKLLVLMHVIAIMQIFAVVHGFFIPLWPWWVGFIIQGVAVVMLVVLMKSSPSISMKKVRKEAADREKAKEYESENSTKLRMKIKCKPKHGKIQIAVLVAIFAIGMICFAGFFMSIVVIENPSIVLLKLAIFSLTITVLTIYSIMIYFIQVNDRKDSIFFRENHKLIQAVLEESEISKEEYNRKMLGSTFISKHS